MSTNLIDYMLVILYVRQPSTPPSPISAANKRHQQLVWHPAPRRRFARIPLSFAHDSEHTILPNNPAKPGTAPVPIRPATRSIKATPQWLWQQLGGAGLNQANRPPTAPIPSAPTEFRLRVADHPPSRAPVPSSTTAR